MPRILYVILFVAITTVPILAIWVAQLALGITAPQPETKNLTNTGTSSHYNDRYHSHYYHRPYYGGFFYYGNRGRGGWLGRNYRSYSGYSGSRSTGSSYSGSRSSRSYSGGRSSFSGGSFGSFGK